jgi:hypothetical protein
MYRRGLQTPGSLRRFAVQVLLTDRGRWTSGAERLDKLMSRISPKCPASLRCRRRGPLARPGAAEWPEALR